MCVLEVGWAEVIRQTASFLLVCVCVCVCVCGAEGGLGGHDQASNVALAASIGNPHLSRSFALL